MDYAQILKNLRGVLTSYAEQIRTLRLTMARQHAVINAADAVVAAVNQERSAEARALAAKYLLVRDWRK